MAVKKRKVAKKAKSAEVSAPMAAAQQRFVDDLETRQESAPLQGGRLALGKTHIQKGRGASKTVTRARFTLTG